MSHTDPYPIPRDPTPVPAAAQPYRPRWGLPVVLFAVTFVSTTYVGATLNGVDPLVSGSWAAGLPFSVPLLAILLTHELGHFIAGQRHRVPVSPPYFIPFPISILGTLGAVIRIHGRIERRNALLDIGAAGPLAGLAVALPVLIWGISESPVQPAQPGVWLVEGRSLLYLGLLYLLKGPIPEGHDIYLTPTAFAGWVGLLVTMINMIPAAQLDGGHIAYALFGSAQERYSRRIRGLLPWFGLATAALYGLPAYLSGARGEALLGELLAGMPWLIWWVLLRLMVRGAGMEHPSTGPEPLSPGRRTVAIGMLVLFVLLFMPSWLRQVIHPT